MEQRNSPGRRADDFRFEAIEHLLVTIQSDIERLQQELNPHYMDTRYITRREIEARTGSADWTLRLLLALITVGQLVTIVLTK